VLDKLVALFNLLFEPNKFPTLPIEGLIPNPFKASIFSFPGEQVLLF